MRAPRLSAWPQLYHLIYCTQAGGGRLWTVPQSFFVSRAYYRPTPVTEPPVTESGKMATPELPRPRHVMLNGFSPMHEVQAVCDIIRKETRTAAPCLSALEAAGSTRLHEPIRMDIDSPPFHRALVDGYALVAAAAPAGAELRILGRQDAGSAAQLEVGPGTCVTINTGAPLPKGADAVVMVEETKIAGTEKPAVADAAPSGRFLTQGSGKVFIKKAASPGDGVHLQGSDARARSGSIARRCCSYSCGLGRRGGRRGSSGSRYSHTTGGGSGDGGRTG